MGGRQRTISIGEKIGVEQHTIQDGIEGVSDVERVLEDRVGVRHPPLGIAGDQLLTREGTEGKAAAEQPAIVERRELGKRTGGHRYHEARYMFVDVPYRTLSAEEGDQ